LSINNEELKFEGTLTSPSCQPNAIKLSKTNPSFKKNINIKCNEYVSPIFIPKENILEINNAAKLAGYPFAEFPYASISNGCGANDDWKSKYVPDGFFGLADFTYACNCHDLCYLTSDNKNICDTKFYNTLVDICNSAEHVNKKGCNKIAELYLESVREFGEEPYRKSRIIQKKYENWLSGYTKKLKVQSVVENTQYGTVKTKQGSPLNLRSKPSEKATIITQIPNGSEVQILAYDNEVTLVAGEKGKWYNVLYDDNIGWVWGNYLKLNPVDIEPATKIEIKFVSDKKEGRANTKEGSPLNLRTEPKIRADNIIAKIPKGSKLIIIGYDDRSVVINGEKGKWYEVQFNNAVGWAWGNYIISASLDSIIESYHDLPGKVADILQWFVKN